MTDSGETGFVPAPKGKAKSLRQKDRVMTMLRKVRHVARRECNLILGKRSGYLCVGAEPIGFCAFFLP